MLKAVSSIINAIGALNYKGTWDAGTNTPTLASGVGAKGDYYVVSVAGNTALDGISNWSVGDWVTFNGTLWQRLEGGADGNFVDLSVTGDVTIADKIVHAGDTDTIIRFPSADTVTIDTGGLERVRVTDSATVFNETGADVDFRIESDTKTHALFVEGSSGNVGINVNSPAVGLDFVGQDGNIRIASNVTDATLKTGRLILRHYTITEEASLLIGGVANATENIVLVGGGSSVLNQATKIQFFTAQNNTTLGSTERFRIKSTGQLRFIPLAADPAGAEAGDVYYNSGTNKLRLYDGSSWVDLN